MLDEYRYVFFFYRTLSGYNTNDCYEKYSWQWWTFNDFFNVKLTLNLWIFLN
jgi:hypothetical protein